jgi:hypothetical protein
MVGSAQLKLVLESSWTLDDLEHDNAMAQLRFRVQRLRFPADVSSQRSGVS